jgi:hypothetical protein
VYQRAGVEDEENDRLRLRLEPRLDLDCDNMKTATSVITARHDCLIIPSVQLLDFPALCLKANTHCDSFLRSLASTATHLPTVNPPCIPPSHSAALPSASFLG